jgi:hypothetical protein
MSQAIRLLEEFDRQVENLLAKNYPIAANLTPSDFIKHIEPLRERVVSLVAPEVDLTTGILPFVVVVKSDLVPTDTAMALVAREGKSGITKLFPHIPTDFHTITGVHIPTAPVYLLVDIDRGHASLNVRPSDAFQAINKSGRSPLTIDEGVAIVTHFPEFLMKNNCFSLLASRHTGDQRVPAIWINAKKEPNLGWCWDGNPHTWLGSASCVKRIAYLP